MTHEILLAISLNSQPYHAFAAWTEARHILKWWNDPDEFNTVAFERDLQVGGAWSVQFEAKDGGRFGATGIYQRIEKPGHFGPFTKSIQNDLPVRHHLAFTWKPDWDEAPPSLVELEFAWSRGAMLSLRHSGIASAEAAEDNKIAWEKTLGWLNAYLDETSS